MVVLFAPIASSASEIRMPPSSVAPVECQCRAAGLQAVLARGAISAQSAVDRAAI
jgi:hypothetical protein